MLVGINFGEKNNKPNENIKNLNTKSDFRNLLLQMGFKENSDGIIMLLDDEKAKKSFFISKTVNKNDEEPVYLKASVLVQVLMYNIVYRYSEQLEKDARLRSKLKKGFDSLIDRINKLYDNMHAQDDDDKNNYDEAIDEGIDIDNALSVDSVEVLNYLIQKCFFDTFLKLEFVNSEYEMCKECKEYHEKLERYLNNVWEILAKNKQSSKLGYLLIDDGTNQSKGLNDIQHVSWNKSKLVLNVRIATRDASSLFEPLSTVRLSEYDDYIFESSGYFGLGMGLQHKNKIKESKDDFSKVLGLYHYYLKKYCYDYDKEKFGDSKIKKCLYDRKSKYLDNLLELIVRTNRYTKEQIVEGIKKFEKNNDRLSSDEKNLVIESSLKIALSQNDNNYNIYNVIVNDPFDYSGNYTYSSVLEHLHVFMKKNGVGGDLQFENQQAKDEFKNLNIAPGTRRTVLFSETGFEDDDSKKKYLPQFLSFVPTKELLKTQINIKNSVDKIYLLDFDRLNDIKDSDKLRSSDCQDRDYKYIVKKIVNEACRKGGSSEFKDIFEHMKSMFMNDKIVFRDDNKEVMSWFFKFFVENQNDYWPRKVVIELTGYQPCVSCLGFIAELYDKYKDSEQCNCINLIAKNMLAFILEKLDQSRVDVDQMVKVMIKYAENKKMDEWAFTAV